MVFVKELDVARQVTFKEVPHVLVISALFNKAVPAQYPAGVCIYYKDGLLEGIEYYRVSGFRAYALYAEQFMTEQVGA